MRCKKGDLAIILRSNTGTNDGKIVQVTKYIGMIEAGGMFEYNGMNCKVPITDNYWWILCEAGLDTPIGPTSLAYIPDTWLLPIPKDVLGDDEETGVDVYAGNRQTEKA